MPYVPLWGPPGCLLGAFWVPPGCLMGASCLPPLGTTDTLVNLWKIVFAGPWGPILDSRSLGWEVGPGYFFDSGSLRGWVSSQIFDSGSLGRWVQIPRRWVQEEVGLESKI